VRFHDDRDRPETGREIRQRMQQACAIAHGVCYRMSGNQLLDYIYEHGLPSREERERILAERLQNAEVDSTE